MPSSALSRTFIGFACGLLVLAGIAVVTYRSTRQALENYGLVSHTHQVLESLQDMLVAVVDLETVVRGYVITGQETFLAPYQQTVAELPHRLEELRALTADNPRHQTRLAELQPVIQAKLHFLSRQMDARRTQGAEEAQALVSSGVGKSLMDDIREMVAAMEREEQGLLAERAARNEESQRVALVVIVLGNIVAVAFLAGAMIVIQHENRRRKQAEQAAIEGRNKLDLILTSLGEGVVAADTSGAFTLFNPAAEKLMGLGATSGPSATWSERYGVLQADQATPFPSEDLPLSRALRGESCQHVEMCVRHPQRPDGVILSVTGRPIRGDAGEVVGGVVVLTDITDRKRHEDEIGRKNDELALAYAELDRTRLQQLQTKDQLLSHVSHELRTPLTAAFQFVEILHEGLAGDLNTDQREYIEIVLRNLKQLRAMIGDLLDATRVESAKLVIDPARMDLGAVVTEVCRTLQSPAAEKGIALVNRVGAVPDVLADANRVRQILTNLLHNAIKFSRDGTITVDARVVGDDARFVQVSVADTGCGIEPDALGRIFTRLYQVGEGRDDARQGLGLGLYICKELATRQGGDIWAESEPGRGSTFHCTFPVYAETAAVA